MLTIFVCFRKFLVNKLMTITDSLLSDVKYLCKMVEENDNEEDLIRQTHIVFSGYEDHSDFFDASLVPFWCSIVKIFGSKWETAKKEYAKMITPFVVELPEKVLALILQYFENSLSSNSLEIVQFFILVLENHLSHSEDANSIKLIVTNIERVLEHSIYHTVLPPKKIKHILEVYLRNSSQCSFKPYFLTQILNRLIIKIENFINGLEYLVFFTEFDANTTKEMDFANLSKTIVDCFDRSISDVLSRVVMLEHISRLAEIMGEDFCKNLALSEFFKTLSTILENKNDPYVFLFLPVCTRIFVRAHSYSLEYIQEILNMCLSSKPTYADINNFFIIYQTLIFIISEPALFSRIVATNPSIPEGICTFLKTLSRYVSEERKAGCYLIFSHLFGKHTNDEHLNSILLDIYMSFISSHKLVTLLTSFDEEQQHAALSILITTSSFDWSVPIYLKTIQKGVLSTVIDSRTHFIRSRNLNLRNDFIKKLLKEDHYVAVLTPEQVILLKNAIITSSATGLNKNVFYKLESQ